MIILGIDPGYAIVGWGIIEYRAGRFRVIDYGAITTPAHMELPRRLDLIYDQLNEIIKMHQPDSMAIEQLFFTTNQKTAISVAQARGIILLAGIKNRVLIAEYTPLQVKQAVVGYGKAQKMQVMDMTKRILCLEQLPKPDDVADALAIAICHAHSSGSLLGGVKLLEKALQKERQLKDSKPAKAAVK